jgi:hypothetical protein
MASLAECTKWSIRGLETARLGKESCETALMRVAAFVHCPSWPTRKTVPCFRRIAFGYPEARRRGGLQVPQQPFECLLIGMTEVAGTRKHQRSACRPGDLARCVGRFSHDSITFGPSVPIR